MKHLRILAFLLAALLCLALAGCNRSTAASSETVTVVEAEYDDDGNLISTTTVPYTVTDTEYEDDGNEVSTTTDTVAEAEYSAE